ncbi:MAG: metallophosphoesterase [Dorea sp.]
MKVLFVIICIIILLAVLENIRELRNFTTTFYRISSSKLQELQETKRVLFLSDLHNHSYGRENERLLAKIKELHPEMILIGGDMLIRKDGNSYEGTVRFLSELPKICPVYYANGNHEQKLKELPQKYEQSYEVYKSSLTDAGIHFLENESVVFEWDGIKIAVTGLEIPLYGYRDFGTFSLQESVLKELIGEPQGEYQILLAHNPDYVKEYQAWGADLILCGHYHGALVGIPGVGGVIAPNFKLFPKYSGGIYREENAIAVVSRGLGTHSVPVRIFNMPELVVLDFCGDKA